ncbi:hypothetical protein NDU88_001018 [Pleurodeles waltl]|uniref:Secreted protein n=1 Tax=Pleurodeles waltl TaxID=8319 RepID=A0AAV7VZV4_PLEWA|nr:hypothetical protein NDU88_001018 [Pleurodeles waltl]
MLILVPSVVFGRRMLRVRGFGVGRLAETVDCATSGTTTLVQLRFEPSVFRLYSSACSGVAVAHYAHLYILARICSHFMSAVTALRVTVTHTPYREPF